MLYLKNVSDQISSITLQNFCEEIEMIGSIITLNDYQRVIPLMRSLAANKTLLVDYYASELQNPEQFGQKQKLSLQTLILAELNNCEVRMVFWPPKDKSASRNELASFAYAIPHDHNFHFASICYSGSGYHTDMYTYDNNAIQHVVGEKVKITQLGQYHLEVGDILIYEKSSDIHTQIPPESLTMTINIIPKQSFNNYQLYFDLNSSEIQDVVEESSQLKYLEKLTNSLNSQPLTKSFERLKSIQLELP